MFRNHSGWPAGGGSPARKVAGTQAVLVAEVCRQDREGDGVRRAAVDHRGAIERVDADAVEGRVVREHVDRHVVAVVPQPELGVVADVVRVRRVNLHGVEPVAARHWIARLGDADALIEGGAGEGREGEVADDPAVGHVVVEDDTVAAVDVRAAGRRGAHRGEERIVGYRPGEDVAALSWMRMRGVDRLHVVVRANIAVGVGRQAAVARRGSRSCPRRCSSGSACLRRRHPDALGRAAMQRRDGPGRECARPSSSLKTFARASRRGRRRVHVRAPTRVQLRASCGGRGPRPAGGASVESLRAPPSGGCRAGCAGLRPARRGRPSVPRPAPACSCSGTPAVVRCPSAA